MQTFTQISQQIATLQRGEVALLTSIFLYGSGTNKRAVSTKCSTSTSKFNMKAESSDSAIQQTASYITLAFT